MPEVATSVANEATRNASDAQSHKEAARLHQLAAQAHLAAAKGSSDDKVQETHVKAVKTHSDQSRVHSKAIDNFIETSKTSAMRAFDTLKDYKLEALKNTVLAEEIQNESDNYFKSKKRKSK